MKNIGDLQIHKGVTKEGLKLVIWDAIPDCDENCPIHDTCPYDRSRRKCEMRRRYLESVTSSLDKAIKEKDEMKMMQMGLMLVPLFNQLVSFKIYSHSIGSNIMLGKKVHPIFREIRESIKMINTVFKDMGVSASDKKNGLLDGDGDYYDEMMKNGKVPSN